MDLNKRKKEFSKAYLLALAAQEGWAIGSWSQDVSKIDISLNKSFTKQDGTNEILLIDFQLKCTERPTTDNEEFVSFTLNEDDFEILSKRKGGKPFILCVVVVPNNLQEWIKLIDKQEQSELHKSTLLKHCGYLAFISDEGDNYLQNDKTIRFYKNHNLFDETKLKQIENKLKDPEYRINALKKELSNLENLKNV